MKWDLFIMSSYGKNPPLPIPKPILISFLEERGGGILTRPGAMRQGRWVWAVMGISHPWTLVDPLVHTASFTEWAPPWRCLWSPVNHHLAIIRRQIFDAKEGRWQSICSLEIHLEWLRRTMLVMTGWRGPRLLPRRWWQGDCEQDNGGKMEPDMDCSKPMVALWTVLRLDQTILVYISKRSISGCSIWTTSIVRIYLQNFESLL